MVTTFGNSIITAFTNGIPVNEIYTYGKLVWPDPYYIKWNPSTAGGQFNIDGTTHNLSTFGGRYYWSTGIINANAFNNNRSITSIETNATSIGSSAFYSCSNLQSAILPECQIVEDCAFGGTVGLYLETLELPKCEYIGYGAFSHQTQIHYHSEILNLPKCSYIGSYAFYNCYGLPNVSLPNCEYIGSSAFYGTDEIKSLDLPKCSYIGSEAFLGALELTQVKLSVCSYIGNSAFYMCPSLTEMYLYYSSVCILFSSGVLSQTPFSKGSGSIYVPSSLVSAYKRADNWSYYSSQIRSIPQ